MKIEDKLAKTKFRVYEESHIQVKRQIVDEELVKKLCLACPAGLYHVDAKGQLQFSYLGCLECGTCRLLGFDKQVETWDYPICDYGVQYRKS